jgi:hypothetical protein
MKKLLSFVLTVTLALIVFQVATAGSPVAARGKDRAERVQIMPTTNEIARMRTTVDASLPDSATILRQVLVDDGRGGKKNTPTSTATRCRISRVPDRRGDQPVGDSIKPGGFLIATLPADVTIAAKDQLRVNGVTYKIEEPVEETSYLLCRRFHVSRVNVS